MELLKIDTNYLNTVIDAMTQSELFASLSEKSLKGICERAELIKYQADEIVVTENDPTDSFYLIIRGEVSILQKHKLTHEFIELGRIQQFNSIGEIGLLLNHQRTATVNTTKESLLLKFSTTLFKYMFDNIPAFGLAISKHLANRVQQLSSKITLPNYTEKMPKPTSEVIRMLPMDFIVRHRVLPLSITHNVFTIGFVQDPTSSVLDAIRRLLPALELEMMHLDSDLFDNLLRFEAGVDGWFDEAGKHVEVKPAESKSPKLDALLKRLVAEGASDLHLSAGNPPFWRIDGDLYAIKDAQIISGQEVLSLMEPVMDDRNKNEFKETNDTDFAYSIADVARFRVNLFRDENGVCAVLRVIPSKILTFEQLSLPQTIKKLCEHPKGLVLVTGPTGSGKSTTLAAMVDYINKNRRAHIITMEDPVEFVHPNLLCLINQRQVGNHTLSFSSALRAALREDPDIVLVGEMRDRETIALALETANTGHLVFGTLHTNSSIATVNRIIDVFPTEQQNQIRIGLSECLKGVIAQNLCKCIGGGRAAAIEVLVVNLPVANLIREEKTIQILSTMQTGKVHGNLLMNESLHNLVTRKKISKDEALSKSYDKEELLRRLDPINNLKMAS
ncbi:MAG: PilT/PilU family type 4a pilus ATPase [Desulfobacterales bacterium]|nr:PilT/PilU family type 4a pilus ATPase [Desulfobacterales bacterium]